MVSSPRLQLSKGEGREGQRLHVAGSTPALKAPQQGGRGVSQGTAKDVDGDSGALGVDDHNHRPEEGRVREVEED